MNTNYQKITNNRTSALSSIKSAPKEEKTNSKMQHNLAKVFSIFLLCLGMLQLSSANAANLLFKSNFGAGVSLGDLYNFYSNGKGAQQKIIGTDKETGFTWPVKALGSDFSGIQLLTVDPITPDTIGNYISNEIRTVTGPGGKTVNELFQNVKIKGAVGTGLSQAPLLVRRPATIGDVTNLYITYWFYYPTDFPSKLDNTVEAGNWRAQFAFKTGGYNGSPDSGDYRFGINILKGKDGSLYWVGKGNNKANGPTTTEVTYWSTENHAVPVPVGEWFKFEVYWHRSSGNDGRFWAAVNGQEIFDYYGPNMGDYSLPITRIFVNDPYSGGYATVESHSTGFEIWDGFPCGDGVSCYNFDSEPPTAPAALSSTMTTNSSSTTTKKGSKEYTITATTASVALAWNASTDNTAVSGYYIYRNGTKIAKTTSLKYTDTLSSSSGKLYSYTVKAYDTVGNLSTASNTTSVVY